MKKIKHERGYAILRQSSERSRHMAHQIMAPWGEIVPGVGPMTADELLRLPDDGWRHELVDGVLIRMPPPGFEHGRIVADIAGALHQYGKLQRLGQVLGAETGFLLSRLGQPDTVLAADVSFVRAENVPHPGSPGIEKYQRLAPDLVVEVSSPDQYKPEMGAKARLYLDAGVRLVWVVWPSSQTVDVWRPGSEAPAATLTVADSLDGLDVLPGFSYPLTDLFS
jgi:Uma2 family endonuclease